MTTTTYLSIIELNKEEFDDVQSHNNSLVGLKKYIPDAIGYTTFFAYNGELWHTDAGYNGEQPCKLITLYHKPAGDRSPVTELPTQVKVEHVVPPDYYSESLLLKLVNATAHPFLGR